MTFKLRLKVLHFSLCFCLNMCQSFGLLCLSRVMLDGALCLVHLIYTSRIKSKLLMALCVCVCFLGGGEGHHQMFAIN